MAGSSLQQQIASMRQSLFDEGLLNEQFIELEKLEDASDPNFVKNVINVFLTDSLKNVTGIEESLLHLKADEPLDITELGKFLHRLKSGCLGIGAKKVPIEVEKMLQCYEAGDMEGMKTILPTMKQEYNILENKLEAYFELLPHVEPGQSIDPPSKGSTSSGE
ncbi:pseudo histidine-containing phosphotransfer protein 2-like [Quercus lobata]|uniref:Histidine-containing phosphotransfer protein n=1 Tax=Quercus lobata TaxID=97700 RepID=A0A7N2R3A7_QUELO|nr:pseudo histidine-containing phosphotransfer protein 2-like [Quercus lobata]